MPEPYVRAADVEQGEMWTLPPGSSLHAQVNEDVQAGYGLPYLPRVLFRVPGLGWDDKEFPTEQGLSIVITGEEKLAQEAVELIWRSGQALRLRERCLERARD